MVSMPVVLGAPEAQLIFTRLTAAATLLPATDPRTMDQKRADLLVDAVLSGLPVDGLPVLQGRRPSINVVVSADTLLGLDDQPAHLTGYGPITAETARRLAADGSGTWRRLLTDPDTGALLDISGNRYRPPQRLRDFVSARDDVCAFPTCNQPGYRCEYEHTVAFSAKAGRPAAATEHWPAAGTTSANSTPAGDMSTIPTAPSPGPPTPATPTPAPPPSNGPRKPAEPRPPGPRPPATLEQVHAEEDAAYQRLAAKWQHEIDQADEKGDTNRSATARSALADLESQRRRQLARRADPDHPPF